MTWGRRGVLLAAALACAVGADQGLPSFDQMRQQLPEPILDSHPEWIALYWKAWELASHNFHEPAPGSGFPSRFIDAAFSDNIYFWDTCFLSMFTNVAGGMVPGIESLDNFYAKQHRDGEISREIERATGKDYPKWVNDDRRPFFSRWGWDGFGPKMKVLGPDVPVQYVGRKPPAALPDLTLDALNHPIAAWAEMESYRYTGNRARLRTVYPALAAYYGFLREHLRQGNGLYLTDWASMDDSPRNPYLKGGGTGADISSEMVLFARELSEMAALIGKPADERRYAAEASETAALVNRLMWSEEKRFYLDLQLDGKQVPLKTISGFWPLLAKVASPAQAAALEKHLTDPKTFGTRHRVPTCAADEPAYRAGVYWQGGVWAPTNTMVIRGLERYGALDLARQIALEHLRTVSETFQTTGTIFEDYSSDGPAPGKPARRDFVGWSGIGPILYLMEYGVGLKPDAPRNRLEWTLPEGDGRAGCRRYRFNGHTVDLLRENGIIRVVSDGAFDLTVHGHLYHVKAGTQEFGGIQAPDRLRVEYLRNPAVIDVPAPRFSWVPRHRAHRQAQTAYRIVVATDPAMRTGVEWDTGNVASSATAQIPYAGRPLASGRTYYWQVRYWDAAGEESPASEVATFTTGLLQPGEWKAQWITGGNELRHEFTLAAAAREARLFVSALGYYELRINGHRVGNAALDPAWTDYRKRALYSAYPVGDLLREGRNVIDVRLGHGHAAQPALLLQLQAGERLVMSSPEWRVRNGPVVSDSLYDGEVYDARKETDDTGWTSASLAPHPPATVSAQMLPPIEVTETLVPLRRGKVADFGQLVSGWARIRVRGERGATVRLRYAETLLPDGNIDRASLRNAKAEDTYILRGEGSETYEPSFTYHGFRYVEVTAAMPVDVEARIVGSAVAPAGTFDSSSDYLNQLERAIRWTLRSNLMGIPTDNNQRDERLGWLGDAHLAANVASLHYDLAAFYTKFLDDLADAQNADGSLPNVVPLVEFAGVHDSDPAWASAYPLLCWHMYREYGDRRILERHLPNLLRLMPHLARPGHFGDWIGLEETPPDLVARFYQIRAAQAVSEIGKVLGDHKVAAEYGALADRLTATYQQQYSGIRTQTAQALAIELKLAVGGDLIENVERHDHHLTTGIIGTRYLLPVLTRIGRSDLAYEILSQRTYPGFGYMLENGATALWELWRFVPEKRMKSHNQVMLATAGSWLYEDLAGIRMDSAAPAWRRIIIEPHPVAGVERAEATLATIAGDVRVAWRQEGGKLLVDAAVPVNSTATLRLAGYEREMASGDYHFEYDPADVIGYHEAKVIASGTIAPWESYDHVIRLVWDFWRNMRNCPNGIPYYLQHQVWKPNLEDPRGLGGDQFSMALSAWNLLYGYLGDEAVKQNMIYLADYWLDHGMSRPSALWPNLPYPYNTELHSGVYDGDMKAGKGFLQPDKAGSFGAELVMLYKMTGNRRYLDAAIAIADTLAAKVTPGDENNSPWPFRVHAETGEVHREGDAVASYTSNWTGTLRLFAGLRELKQGDLAAYAKAQKLVLAWLAAQPLRTNKWGPFFEDVPTSKWSDTEINADTLAAYILENPESFPDGRKQARAILDWTLATFGNHHYEKWGVIPINEQTAFMVEGNSHTARHAAVELLYGEKTGDPSLKADAIRRLNWATYWVADDGRNRYPDGAHWLTDGYGDYVRHYLRAMASAPELAPAAENHLLRTSSTIQSMSYDARRIAYRKFDARSVEMFKLGAGIPKAVKGGKMEWDAAARVLTVHATAAEVVISW